MPDFDYSKDDVEDLAQEEFHQFVDNYSGLMSKEVALAVIASLAAKITDSDFSEV